jgi:hypothetical protein
LFSRFSRQRARDGEHKEETTDSSFCLNDVSLTTIAQVILWVEIKNILNPHSEYTIPYERRNSTYG